MVVLKLRLLIKSSNVENPLVIPKTPVGLRGATGNGPWELIGICSEVPQIACGLAVRFGFIAVGGDS